MATEKKRVTLHPLKSDGTLNTKVNLYPKTFLDAIVDREGEPVDVATVNQLENVAEDFDDRIQEVEVEIHEKQDTLIAGANITIDANNVISSTGGGGAEIYDLDLIENMSEEDLTKLGTFLNTSATQNKEESFWFTDNINLEDLKQYQIVKAQGSVEIEKNYKYINESPAPDRHAEWGDLYWNQEVEGTGFPSAAIINFLFSDVIIPAPSEISEEANWSYKVQNARYYEEFDPSTYPEDDTEEHTLLQCIHVGLEAINIENYTSILEDAGWTVTDGKQVFEELVHEEVPFDLYLAKKDYVSLFFTSIAGEIGEEDTSYTSFLFILDEKPNCFHYLNGLNYREVNFPINKLTGYLAKNDFPLPAQIDSSVITPFAKNGWTNNIIKNSAPEYNETELTSFPTDIISNFIFPESTTIPVPELKGGEKLNWSASTLERRAADDFPEVDSYFTKPYKYLYLSNEQGLYSVNDYVELLRREGWTVTQQPVWAGYAYPEGGYKATKDNIIICFGQEEEIFELAVHDINRESMFCVWAEFTDIDLNVQLTNEYFTDLENAGFELINKSEGKDEFERTYQKDDVNIYIECSNRIDEDEQVELSGIYLEIIDSRIKTYTVDLNLYFKQQKEENNLPVFKYIDIINNNVVSLSINESNILGNIIVIGSGSAGNSYELNLNDYFEEDILNEFKEFINGNNLRPSISFPFINSIDLTKLNTYDKVLLTYPASSGGIEGPTLNPSCPEASNTDDPFPINNLENYIGANFHLPYPVEQASGYTNTEWYSGDEGAGGKGDALVYFEPSWDGTYYIISDFLTRLTNDGWTLRQEEDYIENVDSWIAFKKENSDDDFGVCIAINRGNGESDINDKIYSLHYFWTDELTIVGGGEGKSETNNVILYKQETKSSKGKFEYISIINNTPIKLTLLNREILGETGGGGSGSSIPIFRVEAAPEDSQIIEVNSFNDFEENYCFTLDDQLCCLVLHESSGFILTTVTINREVGEDDSSSSISLYNAEESYILLEYREDYKPEAHWFVVNLEHFSAGGGSGSASTSLAPAWVQGNEYIIGDLVTYKGKLYECLQNNSYWEWESSAWKETSIAESILGLLNEEL